MRYGCGLVQGESSQDRRKCKSMLALQLGGVREAKGSDLVSGSNTIAGPEADLAPKSGHKVVRVGPDGTAWLEASRCSNCGAVMAERTRACRSCGGRNTLVPFRPKAIGRLYSWTVVYRSFPGIKVPFVSAVVDVDGGLALKGTLRLDDHESLKVGMPVRIEFDDAGGAKGEDGRPYVGFHFVTEGAAA